MSKAREIAEERLARGEITEEEFERIVTRLSESSGSGQKAPQYSEELDKPEAHAQPEPEQSAAPVNVGSTSSMPSFLKYVGIYLVFCLIFTFKAPKMIHEGVYDGCRQSGSNPSYCQCVARSYSQQVTFFLAPFQAFTIFIDKTKSNVCRN